MSHPIFWPGKAYYYAIGNTPPIYLFQDLAPEEKSNVLLLGCGDSRNILFSLLTREKAAIQASVDITCCDMEPGVLARNIILFTLLVDHDTKKIQESLWNILFHLYIDQASYDLLIQQSEKLIQFSESLHDWHQGPYASVLSFCSHDTLSRIRQIWLAYAMSATLSQKEKTEKAEDFSRGVKAVREHIGDQKVLSTARAAGPLIINAAPTLLNSTNRYWETGIVTYHARRREDTINNPSLYYSSSPGFRLHYGTSPLQAFHLARGFMTLKPSTGSRSSPSTGPSPDMKAIVADTYAQFGQWCAATRRALLQSDHARRVIVRFFVGDALAFCTALQAYSSGSRAPGQFVKPWSSALLELDDNDYLSSASDPAPSSFNVIDTSNLADHVGLLNLLMVTIPLLSRAPSSVLYTETMLRGGNKDFAQGLLDSLCMEIPVFQVLFGVSPTASSYYLTSQSNAHELLMHRILAPDNGNPQYHERISWKDALGSTLFLEQCDGMPSCVTNFDPSQLALLFFDIYHKVFVAENLSSKFKNLSNTYMTGSYDLIHYVRGSFAKMLLIARKRLPSIDWDRTIELLLHHIENDRELLLGTNYFQDLCCQLHLRGLLSMEKKMREWGVTDMSQGKSRGRFAQWTTTPTIVRVVMVVPRSYLNKVGDALSKSTPCLQCNVISGNEWESVFPPLTVCFGRVASTPGSDGQGPIIIEEDTQGMRGSSSLVFSFWMPMSLLLGRPAVATEFSLTIYSTPGTTMLFARSLGLRLQLFSIDINNKEYLYFSQELPPWTSIHNADQSPTNPRSSLVVDAPPQVRVALESSKIANFTVRHDITDPNKKASLLDGVQVTYEQVSACKLLVHFSKYDLEYLFPYPVNGELVKLRIARKSSYIEVIAPIWVAISSLWKGEINRFPVVCLRGNGFTSWNIHHVVLDSLPLLDLSVSRKEQHLSWYEVHPALAFSDREKAMRESENQSANPGSFDALMNVKDSLHSFFVRIAGLQSSPRTNIFGLHNPVDGGNYTIIFVTGVRLDLGSHTVVADAFVLPLTIALLQKPVIDQALRRLSGAGLCSINTYPNEMTAWKQLLPAFVERCRQWRHRDKCEYLLSGRIPLSTQLEDSPICSCGHGKDTDEFTNKLGVWKSLSPFVTRAAISPIFAVSYLESVGEHAAAAARGPSSGSTSATRRSSRPSADRCAKCGGEGKPKLLTCSRCKGVKYCSPACQKADWKQHKLICT